MDLLVGGVRRLSESRKKSRSLPLSSRGNLPNFALASFDDDGSSSFSEQTPKSKVKRKRRSSCLPLPSSNFRSSSDEGEIGEGGTSNSDTSCSSVEFLRVNKPKHGFDEIWSDTRQRSAECLPASSRDPVLAVPRQYESVPGKLDSDGKITVISGSTDSLSRRVRLEALKARIAAERERIRDSSDEDKKLKPKLGIWRFHSDEALNRGPKSNGHKTRAARTERYLKRKSQEDVSLKHVTHSDPNLEFLEYSAPSWLSKEEEQVPQQTIQTVTPNPPVKNSSLSWNESHAYEEPKRTSDSSNYQSAIESSKEVFNLPKKSGGVANPSGKMSHSPQHHNGQGHSFLPSRKPSPLTVKTVFGGPFSMAQPSPCDSGLSSQSMTSSPSIGRAPTPPPRIGRGSSNLDPSSTQSQRLPSSMGKSPRPVSCALPSGNENIYGRIISRSPTLTLQSECSSSGRSSPWWHRVPAAPMTSGNKPPHSPVKASVKSPLYYYTDVPPPSKTPHMYSYTDQAPNYKGSDTSSSAYMSDSQIESKRPQLAKFHASGYFPRTSASGLSPSTKEVNDIGSRLLSVTPVSRPNSLFTYSGMKSPPITNGRPLSMVLEKSESLDSSLNNGNAIKKKDPKSPPPTPPRRITPTRETTPKSFEMSSEEKEKRRRTSANFEDALQELEEIYQSLGLNDEDLLDRAERRDLPTQHQLKRFSIADPMALRVSGGFPLSRSSSDSYSGGPKPWNRENAQRTPPNRRSAIPDKVSDDLAFRRLQRAGPALLPCKSPGGPGTDTNHSYLQCSPALTPTVKTNGFFHDSPKDEPDVNFDDVTYRKYTQADSVKVPPPHPPFGIPLEPLPKCSPSDYLHATPNEDEKKRVNFFKPESNPDVVRDDMAFRNLRRKNSNPSVGSPLDAACQEVEAWRKPPTRKKDRAIKSLSANLESAYDSIANLVAPADNEKAQSMSDLIAALEQESRKWEAFVKETEVTDAKKDAHGSSTETLTELTPKKDLTKTISLPEPIKGKSGAIYSLMCLSELKKRKEQNLEQSKRTEKSKSPPPVPKRTSNIVLTKRPPHPKGFWSDSETTKSFSSGFDEGSLDDLLSSLTGTSSPSEVKGSSVASCKFEAVNESHAFNQPPPQLLTPNPASASSLENVTLQYKPNSPSAHQLYPNSPSSAAMSAEATRRPTINNYAVTGIRSSSPRLNDTATNRTNNILDSKKPPNLSEMPSTLSSVNPERVAKYKEERRKLHQARFSETAIKYEPPGENSLGTESPFLRRSLRLSKRSNQPRDNNEFNHVVTAAPSEGATASSASESALTGSAPPPLSSSRRRFITRDPSESSDTGTLGSNPGLVRSTRASRLRAQAANSLLLSNGQAKPGEGALSRQDSSCRKIGSDSEATSQKSMVNDLNDNITGKNIASSKFGSEDISSDASELSTISKDGKAKDKSAKRKSNLNRSNVLDEPRPIPSEAHEAARRTRRIRRTSESSQTSGSDKLDNPFVRSASLRVSDASKTSITERLSTLSTSQSHRKSSSSEAESRILSKKRESTDRTFSLTKSEDGGRRKPWALKKPEIPEVLKQRPSPAPSPIAFNSTLNEVPIIPPINVVQKPEPAEECCLKTTATPVEISRCVLSSSSTSSHSLRLSSDSPSIGDVLNNVLDQGTSSNEDIFATPPDTISRDGTASPSSKDQFSPLPVTSVLKQSTVQESISVTSSVEKKVTTVTVSKRGSVDEDKREEVQGILKTLRAAKEEAVVANEKQHPSILKKRGSSEEKETVIVEAVHPILKKNSFDDTGSPVHSILKNRNSIEELCLNYYSAEPKPILKKRVSQEELYEPNSRSEPRPILKKKQGEDDFWEEKPKPILKSRRSLDETSSSSLDLLSRHRFDNSDSSVIKSILKKSFDTEDSDDSLQRPSILKGKRDLKESSAPVSSSAFFSATRVTNRRNSEDAIVSDSCLVSLNRTPTQETRRGSVDADSSTSRNFFRQSPVSFQPLPSILKRKTTDIELAKCELNVLNVSSTVTEENQTTKGTPRRGLKVSDGVTPGHALRERFNRRNVPRYRTQPVTQVEVEETDSLESVQAFRTLIMKKASLNIFEQPHVETKVTPVPTRPLAPEVQVKPEYPKPYRSERKKKFEKRQDRRNNTRYRTLPITVEELAEAEKAEAERASHCSDNQEFSECAESDGVEASSSDELVKMSVAAKASLFQQKAEEVKAASEIRRLSGGGGETARNRFLARRSLSRSQTQPVTEEEVHEAVKLSKEENDNKIQNQEGQSLATEEPSKLSLLEKMKLFTQKQKEPEKTELIRGPPSRRSRGSSSRFRTQPVTTEEVIKASGLNKGDRKSGGLAASILKSAKEMASKDDLTISATSDPRDEDLKSKSVLQTGSTHSSLRGSAKLNGCVGEVTLQSDVVSSTKTSSGTPASQKAKVVERQEAKMDSTESSSSSEDSDSEEEQNGSTKTVLTGGQSHIVINQIGPSPSTPKKISNAAVQRRLNASLRQKEERSLQSQPKDDLKSAVSSPSIGSTDKQPPRLASKDERSKMLGPQRSMTQPSLMASDDNESKKGTIADRLAALQRSGTEDWQKRILKVKPELTPEEIKSPKTTNDVSTPKTIPNSIEKSTSISALKNKLEESAKQWKERVEEKDAVKFTVAGKMGHPLASVQTPGNGTMTPGGSRGQTPHTTPILDRKKKVPTPKVFSSSKDKPSGISNAVKVLPMGISPLIKSKSMPSALKDMSSSDATSSEDEADSPKKGSRVLVPKADNETFSSFFDSRLVRKIEQEKIDISEEVFNEVSSRSHQLLVQKRTVKMQRRHAATSRNPIKALASRTDLQQEYTEVKTGIAEKEVKRLQIEQLAKSSSKCLSALAGLASTEDFKSVALRKGGIEASPLLPHSDVMLVQVKGRRHVQTRLVDATPSSVNSGDSYVLITPKKVICYIGEFTNVIERAKVTEVATVIQQKKDLCFKGSTDVTLIDNEKDPSKEQVEEFFRLLGDEKMQTLEAGCPVEDELYETEVISTNKVYTLKDNALVPHTEAWGSLPKIDILESKEIVVFDFGSEFYVWSGKLAPFDERKTVAKLAKELFDNGYDYSECDINPLCPRMKCEGYDPSLPNKSSSRPSWVVFAKINQHMEPVLFREKFSDWPDLTRIIKVKGQDGDENNKADPISELKEFDAREMLNWQAQEPDLFLEGSHLGRGLEYYEPEERRYFEISTTSLDVWHILEYERTCLVPESHGQFHCGDTYVVRWNYTLMQIGRDFHGNLSRHSFTGRSRCAYFFWQGNDSRITEKGASALMTVELDEERGPQIRVVQGKEHPCFLNLFEGNMVVYRGERECAETNTPGPWKLFMVRGEFPLEATLVEVQNGCQSLRSRSSFVLINVETAIIFIWHGSKCQGHTKEVADKAVENLADRRPEEMLFKSDLQKFTIKVTEEGKETKEFWAAIGSKKRRNYFSLTKSVLPFDFTPRLFHMTSINGTFEATELFCTFGTTKHPCSYPFLQSDIYSVPQPALFLLDNNSEVFLWQGWWPEGDEETTNVATGSANQRFNIDRRCAMKTTLNYCQAKNDSNPSKAYMIHAGREPLVFTNLFPSWETVEEVVRLNAERESLEDQFHPCLVEDVLGKLEQKYYKLEELIAQPLPEGVNPSNLEVYLNDDDFYNVFDMSREEFYRMASWKQNALKKKAQLF